MNNDNPIKDQEAQDETDSESATHLDPEPSRQENSNWDENAEEEAQIEESVDADEAMPAEIAAINTDNDSAEEASSNEE